MTVEDVDALQALKNATQALACDPELQLSLLPDFVDKPFELIDEFDNWSRATLWREGLVITSEQELAVRRVQQAIEAMTEHDLAEEAVRTAETWSELRALASEVLRSFGWPREAPANWSSVYVKASPP